MKSDDKIVGKGEAVNKIYLRDTCLFAGLIKVSDGA